MVGVGKIGSADVKVTEVREMTLGEVVLKFVDVGVAELSNWRLGRGEDDLLKVDDILGMDQLVMNSALIDCAGGRLWLHPGSKEKKKE